MRLGRNKNARNNLSAGKPSKNQSKKNLYVILIGLHVIMGLFYGTKNENTVMSTRAMYTKIKYLRIFSQWMQFEFEKFSVVMRMV